MGAITHRVESSIGRRSHVTPRRYEWAAMTPFVLVHLAPLGALWSGVTLQAVVCCVALYGVRMFAVTAGYHRYFSHRTFRTSRLMQFFLALLAETSAQRGVLWWAAHHRWHHRYSDTSQDVHSPRRDGFFYSHVGWIYNHNSETALERVRDLARFPELRWLNRWWLVPPTVLGGLTFVALGWSGLFVGFALSTVLLWHGTFTINSLSHVFGKRRYATTDDSRNNWLLALITLGEGWHNNHHHFQSSTRQGFFWWEIDITYYVLRVLAAMRLVWGIKEPPARLLEGTSTGSAVAPGSAVASGPSGGLAGEHVDEM